MSLNLFKLTLQIEEEARRRKLFASSSGPPFMLTPKVFMKQEIINLAQQKFQQLSKKHTGFINVVIDNWRGYRFIFDTKDVRNCQNNCQNCALYQLLKNEPKEKFDSGLYPASQEDKMLFGPQNFLNCKTLTQYQNCYINFLLKKANTKKEIADELKLIKNLKIIFSISNNPKILEEKFKQSIIRKSLLLSGPEKKEILKFLIKRTH